MLNAGQPDWWMVWLTAIIAAIGFMQLIVFGIQARRLRQTIRKMDEIATGQTSDMAKSIAENARAAGAMENVSNSLERNARTTEEMVGLQKAYAAIQLRAYVFPQDCGLYEGTLLKPPQPGRFNVPGIVINFRNAGHTPAKQVISWAKITVIEVASEDRLSVPKLEKMSPITLSPGATFPKSIWFERALTKSEIEDISANVNAIYVYGKLEYVDSFGDPRFSNFRFKYNGVFPPLPPIGVFSHCQSGNESD